MSRTARILILIDVSILLGILALMIFVATREERTDTPRPPAWQTEFYKIQTSNTEIMKAITATAFAKTQTAGR
jgi:hypothetical protein